MPRVGRAAWIEDAPACPLREPALPAEHAQAALARVVHYAEATDAPNTLTRHNRVEYPRMPLVLRT